MTYANLSYAVVGAKRPGTALQEVLWVLRVIGITSKARYDERDGR